MARPNILFLMTDHTSARVVAQGSQCVTPSLDALAAEGVRFGRAYTTNAICSPARASLMTATYPSTHGVWDCTHTQRREWVDLRPRRPMFSESLAAAGYRSGYFGKWHVEQSERLQDFGWHEYDLGVSHARGEAIPASKIVVRKEGYRDYLLAAAVRDADCPSHPAFDAASRFLRAHASGANRGQPFCCFVSTAEPHDSYAPPERFLRRYDAAAIRLSPTLRDPPDGKPEVVRRMRSVWESLTDADWQRVVAAHYALVSFLDSEVGRLLGVLRELGLYEDTLIVFTSDHGDMLGGHGLITKGVGTPYEEVYNVPLIVRAPGAAPRGEDPQTVASLVDLAPTLLDLCGAAPLDGAQGRSLRPALEGRADPAAWQDAYAEFYGQRFVYTQRITWHGSWKYVFSPGGIDELYDLAGDPHERRNLAELPEHRPVLIEMTRRMWRKMAEVGDESLLRTEYATLRTAPVGPR